MAKKILIGFPISPKRLTELNRHFEVDCLASKEDRYAQILERIPAYDAVLISSTQVDKAVMDRGRRLKIISNHAVGFDNIDIQLAHERGIAVSNIPKATTLPTATYAMSLLLALLRKVVQNDRKIRDQRIEPWGSAPTLGHAPEGKTLGIYGMGRIGRALAKKALAFDMKILYHNRNQLPKELEESCQATYVSFEELLAQSDVLSLHVPLTPENHHIIDATALAQMKPTAYLVNTARGGHVDAEALIHALQTGQIAGAALDVFPDEPEVNEAFFAMDHVILSPHNGTGTFEDRTNMFANAFENIVAFFEGRHEEVSRVV